MSLPYLDDTSVRTFKSPAYGNDAAPAGLYARGLSSWYMDHGHYHVRHDGSQERLITSVGGPCMGPRNFLVLKPLVAAGNPYFGRLSMKCKVCDLTLPCTPAEVTAMDLLAATSNWM